MRRAKTAGRKPQTTQRMIGVALGVALFLAWQGADHGTKPGNPQGSCTTQVSGH